MESQCYLPHNTGDVLPQTHPDKPVLALPASEGCKAKLTLVVSYMSKGFPHPQTLTHPSSDGYMMAIQPGVC